MGIGPILSAAVNFLKENAPKRPAKAAEINLLDDDPPPAPIAVASPCTMGTSSPIVAGLSMQDIETTIKTLRQMEVAVRQQETELENSLNDQRTKFRDEEINLHHHKYKLLSLIMHAGKTASIPSHRCTAILILNIDSGHYYCYTYNVYMNKWYMQSDVETKECSEKYIDEILEGKYDTERSGGMMTSPYCLFYVREECLQNVKLNELLKDPEILAHINLINDEFEASIMDTRRSFTVQAVLARYTDIVKSLPKECAYQLGTSPKVIHAESNLPLRNIYIFILLYAPEEYRTLAKLFIFDEALRYVTADDYTWMTLPKKLPKKYYENFKLRFAAEFGAKLEYREWEDPLMQKQYQFMEHCFRLYFEMKIGMFYLYKSLNSEQYQEMLTYLVYTDDKMLEARKLLPVFVELDQNFTFLCYVLILRLCAAIDSFFENGMKHEAISLGVVIAKMVKTRCTSQNILTQVLNNINNSFTNVSLSNAEQEEFFLSFHNAINSKPIPNASLNSVIGEFYALDSKRIETAVEELMAKIFVYNYSYQDKVNKPFDDTFIEFRRRTKVHLHYARRNERDFHSFGRVG
jgi:hypothetical protein